MSQEEKNTPKVEKETTELNQEVEVTQDKGVEVEIEQQLQEEKDRYIRLYAEFENYKRRTQKEKADMLLYASQNLMGELLPVVDDFERALKELGKEGENETLKGVQLIQQKLLETLEKKGLKKMQVKAGDDFDAEIHEAITTIPAPDEQMKGKIIDVIETGYQLLEKVVRYPKVVVGK